MKNEQSRQLAVGIGAVVDNGRVLLVKRESENVKEYDNKWELPGGKIEPNEWTEDAIEREVTEETGVQVKCSDLLPFTFSNTLKKDNSDVHVLVFCAKCIVDENNIGDKKPDQEWKWFNVHDIDYEKLIPGSKEFLIYVLNDQNHKVSEKDRQYTIKLENINEEENKKRGYKIVLQFNPDEKGSYKVRKEWGRRGKSFSEKCELFEKYSDALSEVMETMKKRKRNNYKVIDITPNHPLRSWIGHSNIEQGKTDLQSFFDI